MYLLDIKSSPSPTGSGWIWQKDDFLQFECVDKWNLETQNPGRDTSIMSVSSGLGDPSSLNIRQTSRFSCLVFSFILEEGAAPQILSSLIAEN